jgi:hypothetical protein
MVQNFVLVSYIAVIGSNAVWFHGKLAMWYQPVTYVVGRRDVIGAWLICFAMGAMFFGWQ